MQRKTFRLFLLAALVAAESAILVSESAACPPGYRCPPGVACTGPGPGGCVAEGAPPPHPAVPLVPPEERARGAGKRAKDLLGGEQLPPVTVPPSKGDAETDEAIKRLGEELRSRERTVGPSQPPDIPKQGEKIKTTTQKNPDGSTTTTTTVPDGPTTTTRTLRDGSMTRTTTDPDGSWSRTQTYSDGSTTTTTTDPDGSWSRT